MEVRWVEVTWVEVSRTAIPGSSTLSPPGAVWAGCGGPRWLLAGLSYSKSLFPTLMFCNSPPYLNVFFSNSFHIPILAELTHASSICRGMCKTSVRLGRSNSVIINNITLLFLQLPLAQKGHTLTL